jgi:hypothetical protein
MRTSPSLALPRPALLVPVPPGRVPSCSRPPHGCGSGKTDDTGATGADDTDCDDSAITTYPGATELCDGVDNDCDGYDDTLGYWAFDVGSGATAIDGSGRGLDGVIDGATWTTGVLGGGLDFDGVNDTVVLDHTELEPADGFTLSAWVQPNSQQASSWDTVLSRGSTGAGSLGCCGDSYFLGDYLTQIAFYTDIPAGTSPPILDGGSYSAHIGTWHHLMATWDAATGERAVYVDGVETASDTDGPAASYFDGTPTIIGADTNNAANVLFFDGLIDEVKIFDCAVDAAAASADYSSNWPF